MTEKTDIQQALNEQFSALARLVQQVSGEVLPTTTINQPGLGTLVVELFQYDEPTATITGSVDLSGTGEDVYRSLGMGHLGLTEENIYSATIMVQFGSDFNYRFQAVEDQA